MLLTTLSIRSDHYGKLLEGSDVMNSEECNTWDDPLPLIRDWRRKPEYSTTHVMIELVCFDWMVKWACVVQNLALNSVAHNAMYVSRSFSLVVTVAW